MKQKNRIKKLSLKSHKIEFEKKKLIEVQVHNTTKSTTVMKL